MKMAANASDTDSDDILAFYLFTRRRRRKRRYRRISVHPILQKRHIYGEYRVSPGLSYAKTKELIG